MRNFLNRIVNFLCIIDICVHPADDKWLFASSLQRDTSDALIQAEYFVNQPLQSSFLGRIRVLVSLSPYPPYYYDRLTSVKSQGVIT